MAGTRLDVWQVIETLRAEGGDTAATAGYFGISERQVKSCLSYYADYRDEIDAFATAEREASEREIERHRREQTLLG